MQPGLRSDCCRYRSAPTGMRSRRGFTTTDTRAPPPALLLKGIDVTTARTRTTMAALTMTAGLGLGVIASSSALAAPPGNNGTLKVHELGTPSDTENNDPKVCKFNFEAFGLDPNQTGDITIAPQGGDSDATQTLVVHLSTNGDGDGSTVYINADPNGETDALTLEDGHYKATLDNKFGTDPGDKAKSKVFKVVCDDEPTEPPSSTSTTTEPSEPPTSETSTTTEPSEPPTSETSTTTEPSEPPSETSSTTSEPSERSSSSTEGTGTPSDTPSTPGNTMTPPPGGTNNPSGPPVQTDFLKQASDSNTTLVAAGIVGLGLVLGGGYAMRRRLMD